MIAQDPKAMVNGVVKNEPSAFHYRQKRAIARAVPYRCEARDLFSSQLPRLFLFHTMSALDTYDEKSSSYAMLPRRHLLDPERTHNCQVLAAVVRPDSRAPKTRYSLALWFVEHLLVRVSLASHLFSL